MTDNADDGYIELMVCQANRDLLRPGFEREFVASLAEWNGPFTDKQVAKLAKIHARLQQAMRTEATVRARRWRD